MGLRNTRINNIFSGKMPTADALEKIWRAERCNLNWLLTSDGAPFLVRPADATGLVLLDLAFRKHDDWTVYLMQDDQGDAALVLTRPVRHAYEDGAVAHFTGVEVFADAGPAMLCRVKEDTDLRLVRVRRDTLSRLRSGWAGSKELLGTESTPGLLANAPLMPRELLNCLAEEKTDYNPQANLELRLLVSVRRTTGLTL